MKETYIHARIDLHEMIEPIHPECQGLVNYTYLILFYNRNRGLTFRCKSIGIEEICKLCCSIWKTNTHSLGNNGAQ